MSDDVELVVRAPRTALMLVDAPPALVTQLNCEKHLGYKKRQYLERWRDFAADGGRVVIDGKIRGVRPDEFLRWLERRSVATAAPAARATPANDGDEVEQLADKLAAELGLRRVEGAR